LPQHQLEQELARFEGSESAVLFNSGYAANCGILSSLAGPEDLILSDELNHASIIDGCRLSRARVEVYPHGDLAAVGTAPGRTCPPQADRDRLDLLHGRRPRSASRSLRLCAVSGAMLVVDEAHATGLIGPHGAGLSAELDVLADVRMGTLSKAFGVAGAYTPLPVRSASSW